MADIFISYRREDSSGYAGRLYDRLAARFGTDSILMDVDTVEPGLDAIDIIESRVASCGILLALIGKEWLNATTSDGARRLDDPDDFVAIEIAAALNRNVRVIPILVDNARMPRSEELPKSIAKLTRRQALEVRHLSFQRDVERIIEIVSRILTIQPDANLTENASNSLSLIERSTEPPELTLQTITADNQRLLTLVMPIGIETPGGNFSPLIEVNTRLPAQVTEMFSTAADNQPSIHIDLYQGLNTIARDNHFLGRITIENIPAAPKRFPVFGLTFYVDETGKLVISGRNANTGSKIHLAFTTTV